MRTVWKYPIRSDDTFTVSMPICANVIHVDTQNGEPFFWAVVDPDEPIVTDRKFRLCGTGHPIKNNEALIHVGTFLVRDDYLVFHLFEVVDLFALANTVKEIGVTQMSWLQEITTASTVEEVEKIVGDREDRSFVVGYVLTHLDKKSVAWQWADKDSGNLMDHLEGDESS